MSGVTLVDTGPLVALLDARDAHHRWAVTTFADLPETMTTCEAVIAETCFVLARWPAAVDAIFARIRSGTLRLQSMAEEHAPVHAIMRKYQNVPASYADACLVRLSELHRGTLTLVTVDSDFRIYRRHGRQQIPLLAPGPTAGAKERRR